MLVCLWDHLFWKGCKRLTKGENLDNLWSYYVSPFYFSPIVYLGKKNALDRVIFGNLLWFKRKDMSMYFIKGLSESY